MDGTWEHCAKENKPDKAQEDRCLIPLLRMCDRRRKGKQDARASGGAEEHHQELRKMGKGEWVERDE